MIEYYLNFRELCFVPLHDRGQDSKFHLSHFQKSGYVCRLLSPVLLLFFLKYFSHILCRNRVKVFAEFTSCFKIVFVRLMSHCFFPLKIIAFYCTQYIQFSVERNARSILGSTPAIVQSFQFAEFMFTLWDVVICLNHLN